MIIWSRLSWYSWSFKCLQLEVLLGVSDERMESWLFGFLLCFFGGITLTVRFCDGSSTTHLVFIDETLNQSFIRDSLWLTSRSMLLVLYSLELWRIRESSGQRPEISTVQLPISICWIWLLIRVAKLAKVLEIILINTVTSFTLSHTRQSPYPEIVA